MQDLHVQISFGLSVLCLLGQVDPVITLSYLLSELLTVQIINC